MIAVANRDRMLLTIAFGQKFIDSGDMQTIPAFLRGCFWLRPSLGGISAVDFSRSSGAAVSTWSVSSSAWQWWLAPLQMGGVGGAFGICALDSKKAERAISSHGARLTFL